MYVIGTTGQGKSKYLENLLVGDIRAGRGCGLVDPHADLAQDTLAHLLSTGYFRDSQALQRVIYFDPTRTDYVIPFNILKAPLPRYTLAQQVIEAFRRTWPHSLEEAPRFTTIALAALLVLISTGKTLVDMSRLLTDRDFRNELLATLHEPELIEFFHTRFDRWGREGSLMIESTLNKVSAFAFNPHLRRLLGASENRLDFRAIMDRGQVLIVDLGHCDGETRRLVGSLVVTGLEQAALSRKDTPGQRRPFYLYLDEFQDFTAGEGAAMTLAQILSEARKYGLHLHLAHQTLGQIQARVSSALGNVGIKVVFAADREDAEVLARKLFSVNTEAIKHAAQTDMQHPLFTPLPEQWEGAVATIQALRPRMALVKRQGADLVQIRTEPIRPYRVSATAVDSLKTQLARIHGMPLPQGKPMPPVQTRGRQPPPTWSDWEVAPGPTKILPKSGVIFSRQGEEL